VTTTLTPCQAALPCPEDMLDQPWHDNEPDVPEGSDPRTYIIGMGHNEFVPHKEDWYREPGSGKKTPDGRRRRRALERCWNECPVKARLACLEIGLAQGEASQHGIWGGYTEDQRQQILAARRAQEVDETVTDEE
jgi:hypothetical protein